MLKEAWDIEIGNQAVLDSVIRVHGTPRAALYAAKKALRQTDIHEPFAIIRRPGCLGIRKVKLGH